MPIYPVKDENKKLVKKDGVQKYLVRINYTTDCGKSKQLTRTAYGSEAAKDLETELKIEVKSGGVSTTQKMTLQMLFDEYIHGKQHEVKGTSLRKSRYAIENHILPTLKDIHIDKLGVKHLQEWKVSMSDEISQGVFSSSY